MTLEEYKSIGEKYDLVYDDYEECLFLKGKNGDYRFVVSSFKGDKNDGIGGVYRECVISNIDHSVYPIAYYSSVDPKVFEDFIKGFFRNYKKALIVVKTMELEKDFKND